MSLQEMSFSGAVFIIAIVIIRALAINRLPKGTFTFLWKLALLRLLIPFSVPSGFSVYTLIERGLSERSFLGAKNGAELENGTDSAISALQRATAVPDSGIIPQPAESANATVSLVPVVWCAGMIIIAAFFIISYLHCLSEFRTALPFRSEYAEKWLKECRSRRKIVIRQSDRISAPLTYGIFRPVILMPKNLDPANTQQLQYILTHEYIHIRRFDAATKLFIAAALIVHWFNPAVWVMYILFNRDIELACDEGVIRCFGEKSRAAYSMTLIEMEAKKSGISTMPFCNNFSRNAAEERITAIMKTKKATVLTIALASAIVLGTAGVFATSAAKPDNSDNKEYAVSGNNAAPENYSDYIPFGLTVENGKLYYDGKLVRCFDDKVQAGFSVKAVGYYEKNGEIDVRAVRDENGALTGLEKLSDEEFQSKIVEDSEQDVSQSGTSFFDVYEKYGLIYDESQNALFYEGKRVRLFWDSLNYDQAASESETPFGNSISNWDESGVIDVYAVRDYSQKDKDGFGTLTGVRTATEEEFDENTKLFSDMDVHAITFKQDGENALNGTTNVEFSDATMMSYIDPRDGKTYYSSDGGQTFEALTDEEFNEKYPVPKVEWWTYDEYKAWLDNEKIELQSMLGEKAWTGGRGDFVWTQEIIDETIALYESILEEIKNGTLVSKSVDGDTEVILSMGIDGIMTTND